MNKKNSRSKWLATSVIILLICVVATSIALASRLNNYLLDDSGAIPIVYDLESDTDKETVSDTTSAVTNNDEIIADSESNDVNSAAPSVTSPVQGQVKPGFEASDDNTVWETDTNVEIFKVSYENGEHVITVNSSDGDKVIAPGTENSYTFKLKNTGNVAVSYSVEVDAYFAPEGTVIPVNARLCRYDGKWIVGSADKYVDIPTLDTAADESSLGAGKYTYYTLDWEWPFESGNDEFDTMLGNLAAEDEELTLTIEIRTVAEATWDEDADIGIIPPQTGDISHTDIWIIIAATASVLMIILIVVQIADKRKKDSEEAR